MDAALVCLCSKSHVDAIRVRLQVILTAIRYQTICRAASFNVSMMWISRTFKAWRWSFKKPDYKQLQKYSWKNIEYYGIYLAAVQEIPWAKLKFADEGHFKS